MKHAESSRLTRLQLADALKKRMAHKPLSKITVSELIADCDLNRKTFYYHFEDIYALFKWMIEQEAIAVVKQFDMTRDFREVLQFAADYVLNNQHMINAAYDSVGREGLKRFFYQDIVGIAQAQVDGVARQENVALAEDFRAFLGNYLAEAIVSTLLSWVDKPDIVACDRERTLAYLEHFLQHALPEVIRSAKDKGPDFVA